MAKIKLLPDDLVSQVAAGEVIERPASVVKELVENSIDAGARKIEVVVNRGGISLIRVVDDGEGMNRTDALLAVERHATSKIATKEDLAAISTLGFRGEALPSIASVSRFRLSTREREALSGTAIEINGGKLSGVKDSGDAPGTQIEVRSLFYNLPARRKFLRTENTEFSHVEHQTRVQAIAHPEIAFTLVRDERAVFQLPATKRLIDRVRGLVGSELASELIEVPREERNGVTIWGQIGRPGIGRSNRSQQYVFLNGRPVEAPLLQYALREGYHTALMKGQYPVTFLFLEMDPGEVDVNVHPAKREVRFRDGNGVKAAVVEAVSRAVLETPAGPFARGGSEEEAGGARVGGFAAEVSPGAGGGLATVPEGAAEAVLIPEGETRALRQDWADGGLAGSSQGAATEPALVPTASPPSVAAAGSVEGEGIRASIEDFRMLGVLGKLYVLLESAEGMVLMDQHAAHERVLFEEMRRRMETEGVPSQRLLIPLTIEFDPKEFDLVRQNLETLQRLGISAEEFGANTLKVDSLPTFLKSDEKTAFVNQVVEELKSESARTSSMRLGEDMVATTVCRHAVKANDPLHEAELMKLLEDLLACEMPYCCPHGRPTLIQMTYGELERRFGRRVP